MVYAFLASVSLISALVSSAALWLILKRSPVPAVVGSVVASLLSVVVIIALQEGATYTKEYLSYYYSSATYTEDWNEWVEQQCCTESCSGSGKDRTCTTTCVDCSHSEYHPPCWEAEDNAGNTHGIDQSFYKRLVSAWGNETFEELNRDFYTDDGDRYHTSMPDSALKVGSPALFGYTRGGTYKNKVRGSRSVFNYVEVDSLDSARYGLFKGTSSEPLQGIADQGLSSILRQTNWLHGMQDQVHLSVMVFKDQPPEAGYAQEALMVGGNKNEFTVIIGLSSSDSTIRWVRPVSWTTQERLKLSVRSDVLAMGKFDGPRLGMYLAENVPKKFIRRQFSEFDYLPDAETLWMYLIAALLPIIGAVAGVVVGARL